MNDKEKSLKLHEELKGKIEVISRYKIKTQEDLALLYSPGVAEPCLKIYENPDLSYTYTRRNRLVAVITDGSAVLGLGDIGPVASMPVMEGKAILFKELADVDAFPICISSKDVDEIVQTIELISKSFGGINIEDISAPRCFEIEKRLKEQCDIPIFHDDQHGTAVVVGAALINSLKLVDKNLGEIKVVINGAGAAGTAITLFLSSMGVKDIIVCDKFGILSRDDQSLSDAHKMLVEKTNHSMIKGSLMDAVLKADVLIGVSKANLFTQEMISIMNDKPIVFAMANPVPEISPNDAYLAGTYIIGTGSSKYPNQINNVLAFPGIFRGTLDSHAKEITHGMMMAASKAIADSVDDSEISINKIMPNPLDKQVHDKVAKAVYQQAIIENVEKTHE